MKNLRKGVPAVLLVILLLVPMPALSGGRQGVRQISSYDWSQQNEGTSWAPRAGLQVVELRNNFFLMGGRTPLDPAIVPVPGASTLWSDVWRSKDLGKTWEMIRESDSPDVWPARAYFQALTMKGRMFILGGQNFKLIPNPDPNGPPMIPASDFFNDVWSSRDGVHWTQLTEAAPWAGRAGLSAAVFKGAIYVMGGSFNDDSAIVGGQPARVYFNDVGKSKDGITWKLLTEAAPWAPRAGGVAVTKGGYLYMVGGEDGFICQEGGRCPPYYNDVWRTRNGRDWELVTAEAAWSSRPGHQCVVLNNHFVLFGGFGLSPDPTNPFLPSNPMDVWVSQDGAKWHQVSDSPWNAVEPADIKYDFDALVSRGRGQRPAVFTFGGDRETFNFFDPENYLRVDDDVWRFGPTKNGQWDKSPVGEDVWVVKNLRAAPNPFNPVTSIRFALRQAEPVQLAVFDLAGHRVRTLLSGTILGAGEHEAVWDGRNDDGGQAASGKYFYRLDTGTYSETKSMVLMK